MAFYLAYCGRVIIHHVFVPHLLYFLRTSLFAGVFSHSEGCLSLSFRVSFAVQMLLRLIQTCLLSFGLFLIILGTLGGIDITACPPILSSNLHSIHPIFRSLSSLKLIFVYSLRDILISLSFSLLMYVHTLLHSGFHYFHFQQWRWRVPFSSWHLADLTFVDCLTVTILIGGVR